MVRQDSSNDVELLEQYRSHILSRINHQNRLSTQTSESSWNSEAGEETYQINSALGLRTSYITGWNVE